MSTEVIYRIVFGVTVTLLIACIVLLANRNHETVQQRAQIEKALQDSVVVLKKSIQDRIEVISMLEAERDSLKGLQAAIKENVKQTRIHYAKKTVDIANCANDSSVLLWQQYVARYRSRAR